MAVYTDRTHNYSAHVSGEDDLRQVLFRRQADDLITEEVIPLPGSGPITLRVEARHDAYTFDVVVDGQCSIIGQGSARLLSAEAAEWFLSVHFALTATGTAGTASFADARSTPLPKRRPVLVPHFARDL